MVGFADLLYSLSSNLQMSSEMIIMILFLFPVIVFFASDFKIGVISSIVISSALFIYFYEFGFEYDIVLLIMLLFTVVLAFTLYFISRKGARMEGIA